jgi:hypothetical protein
MWLESRKEHPATFTVDAIPLPGFPPITFDGIPLSGWAELRKARTPSNLEKLQTVFPTLKRSQLRNLCGRTLHQLLAPIAKRLLFLDTLPIKETKRKETSLGLLVQLVLHAGKAGVVDLQREKGNMAFNMFQEYAWLVAYSWLSRVPEVEQVKILGNVFLRLSDPINRSLGFKAPPRAGAFSAYITKAIRSPVKSLLNKKTLTLSPESVIDDNENHEGNQDEDDKAPARRKPRPKVRRDDPNPSRSIAEAAQMLGVRANTLWYRMKSLGFDRWSQAALDAVQNAMRSKSQWLAIVNLLVARGRSIHAARKQVQRWKKEGRTAEDLTRELLGG